MNLLLIVQSSLQDGCIHGKLHTMMKNAIGGNLVRWNATHFGTNYHFLESFLRRKDCFMQ
jgi:hypothetical protein